MEHQRKRHHEQLEEQLLERLEAIEPMYWQL
jgi:hypothetical protein